MNTELLLRTWEQVRDHPETWEQEEWRSIGYEGPQDALPCATAYCFAGWAVTLGEADWLMPDFLASDGQGYLVAIPKGVEVTPLRYELIRDRLRGHTQDDFDWAVRQHPVGTEFAHVEIVAAAMLGLDQFQAAELFNSGNSLEDLYFELVEILGDCPNRMLEERADV